MISSEIAITAIYLSNEYQFGVDQYLVDVFVKQLIFVPWSLAESEVRWYDIFGHTPNRKKTWFFSPISNKHSSTCCFWFWYIHFLSPKGFLSPKDGISPKIRRKWETLKTPPTNKKLKIASVISRNTKKNSRKKKRGHFASYYSRNN